MSLSRRELLTRSAAGLGVAVLGRARGVLDGLPAGAAPDGGYGPLTPSSPANGGPAVLALPQGFTYRTFGATGSPLKSGGGVHARNHDGMAALPTSHSRVVRLTRN